MIRNDYAMTGSAGEKGRTGQLRFLVFGIMLFAICFLGGGNDLYLVLAALIGRAAGHTRQEEYVKRKKE
jgi:hypothetical protein